MVPYYNQNQRYSIIETGDPVRYGSIDLALQQILKDRVPGSLAECGVYKGTLSKFIHDRVPDRRLFLFDTFQGFDRRDCTTDLDLRFKDTSEAEVLRYIGNSDNITIRKGYFPDTSVGLENENFAFVMIDFDKYKPTMAALTFFYPRVLSGGYIVVHDYNSPESDWACSRALDKFLVDKPEKLVPIPDGWGSAIVRKI